MEDRLWEWYIKSGQQCLGENKLDDAERHFLDALNLAETFGEQDQRLVRTVNFLALLQFSKKNYSLAEPYYVRAIGLAEKLWGQESPQLLMYLHGFGTSLLSQSSYGRAESVFSRALNISEKVHGLTHPEHAKALKGLAVAQEHLKQYAKAEATYEQLLGIFMRNPALAAEKLKVEERLRNVQAAKFKQMAGGGAVDGETRLLGYDEISKSVQEQRGKAAKDKARAEEAPEESVAGDRSFLKSLVGFFWQEPVPEKQKGKSRTKAKPAGKPAAASPAGAGKAKPAAAAGTPNPAQPALPISPVTGGWTMPSAIPQGAQMSGSQPAPAPAGFVSGTQPVMQPAAAQAGFVSGNQPAIHPGTVSGTQAAMGGAPAVQASMPTDIRDFVGATLDGRYEILSFVGEGGMSVVYKGRHKLMDKIVPVKMLLPKYISDNTVLQRFQQEARA